MSNEFYTFAKVSSAIANKIKYLDKMKRFFMCVAAVVCAATVMVSCGGKHTNVTKGDKSKLDTLSYALGANIGFSVAADMGDIPFDFKTVDKGITEGALDKSSLTQEDAIGKLRTYFMQTRWERKQKIDERNAADSTYVAPSEPYADPDMFESEEERADISYAFGIDIGNNVKAAAFPIQLHWLLKGMNDALDGNAEMSMQEVNQYLQNYFMVVLPQQNAEKSEAWLAKMERKAGVKKTESGLLYKVVRKGDADIIAKDARDTVVVNYEGKTADGVVFDSSYEREEPFTTSLNRVIRGWTEGMQLVGKGGKIILWLPSELAYGPRQAGRDIGPNSALQFTVEVLDVKPYVDPTAKAAEETTEEETAEEAVEE